MTYKDIKEELPFLIDGKHLLLNNLPSGWKNLALDFFKEIKPLLIKYNFFDKYVILDIKEKYGRLAIYTNSLPDEMEKEYKEIYQRYEDLSLETCINCGDKGKVIVGYWIVTQCKKCYCEYNPLRNKYKYEDVTERGIL